METVSKFKNCLYALGCTPETTFYVKYHNSKRSMWTLTRRTNKLSDEYHCNSLKDIQNRAGHNHTYRTEALSTWGKPIRDRICS